MIEKYEPPPTGAELADALETAASALEDLEDAGLRRMLRQLAEMSRFRPDEPVSLVVELYRPGGFRECLELVAS